MTDPVTVTLTETDIDAALAASGKLAVFADADGKLSAPAKRIDTKTRKAISRMVAGQVWADMDEGEVAELAYPTGVEAEAILVAKLSGKPDPETARKAGAGLAKKMGKGDLTILTRPKMRAEDVVFGAMLRAYAFQAHKTDAKNTDGAITLMAADTDVLEAGVERARAVAEGVFFTRDLVSEPANHLTTTEFANRLIALSELGVKVEVLEEDKLEELGMGALLCVGLGSASPSKVVVMEWNGGGDEAPFALVGKGVVFDTGGISLKPAAGMEDMTMDMGGAGVVAGVMKTLARRGAKANVVGLVGLVENMPSERATRPGDVVTSMKGDTIEVINTDAEGRLVLCDVMWYAQERFKPTGMIDLATLTGAIIVGLGHEKAGVFSNSDDLSGAFLKAAEAEVEGAWRMPLAKAYDDQIKSQIADMKNVGGKPAGSITAAQFLARFVKEDTPWCHLDIAGVASVKSETALAPKGATGWGVRALDRLIADHFEAE